MVVENVGNESPVVTKDRDIPSHECDLAVIENLKLFSASSSSIVVVDKLFEISHGLLVDIFELVATVSSLMDSLPAMFFVIVPNLALFTCDFLFLLLNELLFTIWTHSLEFVQIMIKSY